MTVELKTATGKPLSESSELFYKGQIDLVVCKTFGIGHNQITFFMFKEDAIPEGVYQGKYSARDISGSGPEVTQVYFQGGPDELKMALEMHDIKLIDY